MGVLINATQNKQIKLIGTDVNLDSAYARVNFKAYPDGSTLEIGVEIYYSKAKYAEGIRIFTDIPDGNFMCIIDSLTEAQSLDTAYVYAIQRFEQLGYQCQII